MGLALLLVLLLVVPACGYSTRRLVSEPGVASVAVLAFDNQTFRRDLEQRLTKAVAEEVRARTPWRLLSPSTADALLSGTIRLAQSDVLAEDDDPLRTAIARRWRFEVDCRLVHRSTGRVLRTYTVTSRTEFAPGRFGETEDASATDAAMRALAASVVFGLERPVGGDDAAPLDVRKRGPRTDPAPRSLPFLPPGRPQAPPADAPR